MKIDISNVKDFVPKDRRWLGTYRNDSITRVVERILTVLNEVGITGIKHVELASRVSIDRKNLTHYMDWLIHLRLVTREKGRQGKYVINEKKIFGYNSAILFGHKALRLLPREPKDSRIVRQMSKPFVNYTSIREFGPEAKKFGLTKDLFEFSNVLGAYILFVLIQAMNPDNKKLYENRKPTVDMAQKWSEKAISYMAPYLLLGFRKYIEFSLLQHLKFKSVDEYFSLIGNAKTICDELIVYYTKLYPVMFYELNKIRKEFLV